MGLLEVKEKGIEILKGLRLADEMGSIKYRPEDMESNPVSIHRDYYKKRKPTIFKQDFLNITDGYYDYKYKDTKAYSDTALAIAIVWEVIDHHHMEGDLGACLYNNGISLDTFDKMNNGVRRWCNEYYWKDGFEYWDRKWVDMKSKVR